MAYNWIPTFMWIVHFITRVSFPVDGIRNLKYIRYRSIYSLRRAWHFHSSYIIISRLPGCRRKKSHRRSHLCIRKVALQRFGTFGKTHTKNRVYEPISSFHIHVGLSIHSPLGEGVVAMRACIRLETRPPSRATKYWPHFHRQHFRGYN